MKITKYKIFFFLIGVFLYSKNVYSQSENALSFMDNLYQSTYYSPFNTSEFKVSIGLPGLSSVYLNARNSGFSALQAFQNKDVTKKIDPSLVLDKMKSSEYVGLNTQVDLFHLFVQKGEHGFSFNITENVNARFSYPSDLLRLAWRGNGPFVGDQINLSKFAIDYNHYREYVLGYYRTKDKWQFGGKAKFLFGKSAIQTKKSTLTIDVENDYDHLVKGDFLINTAGFSDFGIDFSKPLDSLQGDNDEDKAFQNYILNNKNKGFALDFGTSFKYSEKLQFNAAVSNLGFIRWKEKPANITYNEEVAVVGVDVFEVLFKNNLDSLEKGFENYFDEQFPDTITTKASQKSFTTYLPVNIALGARYDIWKKTYAVGRVNFTGYKGIQTAVTVGVYHDFFRWFNIGLTNTYMYGRVWNPGLGLVLKGGPVQFYLATDNLYAAHFMRTKQASIRFGINLVFGKIKDQEKISSVIK